MYATADWNNGSNLSPPTDGPDKWTWTNRDAFGRLVSVQLPGDANATITYEYSVSKTAPSWVKQRTQIVDGTWVDSYSYIDGLGRTRETQTAGPNGGRLISATGFDGRGLAIKQFSNVHNSGTLGSGLFTTGPVVNSPEPKVPELWAVHDRSGCFVGGSVGDAHEL